MYIRHLQKHETEVDLSWLDDLKLPLKLIWKWRNDIEEFEMTLFYSEFS